MSTYKERLEAEIIDLRDTLDAARRQREEEHRLRRKAEAKVARVEALVEDFRKAGFTGVYESAIEIAELIDRALAEPERDEERGLAVTVWDEITEGVTLHDVRANPSERDEEGGR